MFGKRKKIDAAEITEQIRAGRAVLVDVRSDEEWSDGHAAGAIHIPIERIMQDEVPTRNLDQKWLLYCASGGRAGRAADYLNSRGFEAENIGGLNDWRNAGGEVT